MKNENCTIFIPKGNSYCRRKSSAKDLGLKSHPKDYQQKVAADNKVRAVEALLMKAENLVFAPNANQK